MRFFIALEIPDTSKKQLEQVQQKLKQIIPEVRLTDSEKVHLTLAFVGEQNNSLVNDLIAIIQKAVQEIAPFEVTPAYIDGFPELHHPQVFWVGVKGDIDKILLIRERIKDGLVNLHLPTDERRFIPHISIAKINKNFSMSNVRDWDSLRHLQLLAAIEKKFTIQISYIDTTKMNSVMRIVAIVQKYLK